MSRKIYRMKVTCYIFRERNRLQALILRCRIRRKKQQKLQENHYYYRVGTYFFIFFYKILPIYIDR